MKNKIPRSKSWFLQTWKGLLIYIYVFSAVAFAMTFTGKILLVSSERLDRGGLGLCTVGTILMVIILPSYIGNFRYLNRNGANLDQIKFIIGFLPSLAVFLLNILILVF